LFVSYHHLPFSFSFSLDKPFLFSIRIQCLLLLSLVKFCLVWHKFSIWLLWVCLRYFISFHMKILMYHQLSMSNDDYVLFVAQFYHISNISSQSRHCNFWCYQTCQGSGSCWYASCADFFYFSLLNLPLWDPICKLLCLAFPYESIFVNCIGDRTFGVLTKLDLMDKGTNAMDVRSLSLSLSHTHTHTHTHARTTTRSVCG